MVLTSKIGMLPLFWNPNPQNDSDGRFDWFHVLWDNGYKEQYKCLWLLWHVCGNIPAKSSWLDWSLSIFPFQNENWRILFSLNRIYLHLGWWWILLVFRDLLASIVKLLAIPFHSNSVKHLYSTKAVFSK